MQANSPPQSGSGTNRNLLIGIVVAVVLCCCCAVTAAGGYYGYQGYVRAQQTFEEFQNFEIPEFPTSVPFDPNDPNSGADNPLPGFDLSGDVPEGGLADESTRYTAWTSVQFIGFVAGCETPSAEGTTISVLQQPDSNGVWVEEWNVNCGGGTSHPFKIRFTPENGIVNVNIDLQ
ncbi:MAG: hypothetical protein QY332_13760 [Anaerolineales bacterium]|nr:MAG: hypothetical protein QY332_13760 [Anaerolineales bacterium]